MKEKIVREYREAKQSQVEKDKKEQNSKKDKSIHVATIAEMPSVESSNTFELLLLKAKWSLHSWLIRGKNQPLTTSSLENNYPSHAQPEHSKHGPTPHMQNRVWVTCIAIGKLGTLEQCHEMHHASSLMLRTVTWKIPSQNLEEDIFGKRMLESIGCNKWLCLKWPATKMKAT